MAPRVNRPKPDDIRRNGHRKKAPTEVASTGQRGEGGAQDIENSEITIYDISRYRYFEGREEGNGNEKRVRETRAHRTLLLDKIQHNERCTCRIKSGGNGQRIIGRLITSACNTKKKRPRG